MTITRKRLALAVGGAAIGGLAVVLCAQASVGMRAGVQSAALSARGEVVRPQLTRLQVDLFELRCSPKQLLRLDLMDLGHTDSGPMKASSEQILERLGELGEARLAVRYDNFVNLVGGTSLNTGKSIPTVRDVAVQANGVIVPSVSYRSLGFEVRLKGNWLEASEPNLAYIELDVERSDIAPENLEVGIVGKNSRLDLPVLLQFESNQQVIVRQGQPTLLACNDLSKEPDENDNVPVLVARVVATRLIE